MEKLILQGGQNVFTEQVNSLNFSKNLLWLGFFILLLSIILISSFLIWHWREYSVDKRASTISQSVYISGLVFIFIWLVILISNL